MSRYNYIWVDENSGIDSCINMTQEELKQLFNKTDNDNLHILSTECDEEHLSTALGHSMAQRGLAQMEALKDLTNRINSRINGE